VNKQVIGDDGVGLSPEDLAALRESLEEQRRFRREQLRQIDGAPQDRGDRSDWVDRGDPSDPSDPSDRTDEQQAASQTEVRLMLAASARMVLTDVEAALDRMARGRYGTCHLCTRSISLARLTIVPQARYCARCQQVRETAR